MNRPINGVDLDGLEWVLKIYSPQVSSSFLEALDAGNIIEQRRLTYFSLQNQFVGEDGAVSDWAQRHSTGVGQLHGRNTGASLKYDISAPDGLTVYLSGYFTNEDEFTAQLTGNIDFTDKIHFGWSEYGGPPDEFFPVDIKLLDSDGSLNGDDFYGGYDFLGNTVLDFSINGMGKSFLSGRMRGFGYLEFSSNDYGVGAGGVQFGTGPLTGKYFGPSMSPKSPMGKLGFFLGEGETNLMTGDWRSMNDSGSVMWRGEGPTLGVGLEVPGVPGLNMFSKNYVSPLNEFMNSTKQRNTIKEHQSKRN